MFGQVLQNGRAVSQVADRDADIGPHGVSYQGVRVMAQFGFPATRMTKRSPSPWSKINSAGTRESEQPRTIAKGACP